MDLRRAATLVAVLFLAASVAAQAGLAGASSLYVHGGGDTPSRWADAMVAEFGGFALDWTELAKDRMAAPARGYRLGRQLASQVTTTPLTIYAHSAGAWVAQGLADGLASMPGMPLPTVVFLDPFTAYSLFDWGAGAKRLGRNFAQVTTYYTTLDPVPFTRGKVAVGERINLDADLAPLVKGTPAHWAVVEWYFAQNASAGH